MRHMLDDDGTARGGVTHPRRSSRTATLASLACAACITCGVCGTARAVDLPAPAVAAAAPGSGSTAPVPTTPMAAIERARHDLLSAVASARRGELSQQGLRMARRAIEVRLDLEVSRMDIELRPGEMALLADARSKLNHAIIRSQEWEAFGPADRPEWGWYPSRTVESVEHSITVTAAATTAARPG